MLSAMNIALEVLRAYLNAVVTGRLDLQRYLSVLPRWNWQRNLYAAGNDSGRG